MPLTSEENAFLARLAFEYTNNQSGPASRQFAS